MLEYCDMDTKDKIQELIENALSRFGAPHGMVAIILDHPSDPKNGDYSTNVALLLSKQLGASSKNPLDLAEKIVEEILKEIKVSKTDFIEKIEAVPPGFINFHFSKKFFVDTVAEILDKNLWYGKNNKLWKEKVMVEYTDPNPFKEFHIGHLMSNTIGETLSRIIECNGAQMERVCYQGDVGLHVAMTLWAWLREPREQWPKNEDELQTKVRFLGRMYATGATAAKEDEKLKREVAAINKKVYERSDDLINDIYDAGREWSLMYFEEIYRKLGTRFNNYFFESKTGLFGKEVVEQGLERGIFEKSENAIIFRGEQYGLHTRVFINSEGLPTYEAKELGLAKTKYDTYPYTTSVIVTGNEINDYFKVLLKAMSLIFPELAEKTKHLSHGMLRLPTGKMSSRTGQVITGESLLNDVEELVQERLKDREYTKAEKQEIAERVAVGAIKYSILKQSIGKDIIFDFDKSLSFEGDSGPYLQYAYVRAKSILAKAKDEGIHPKTKLHKTNTEINPVERLLFKYPGIVERACAEYAPNFIATYLIQLAGEFNAYYAKNKIVDEQDPHSPYKVALTEAVSWVLKNGLYLLGINTPERM